MTHEQRAPNGAGKAANAQGDGDNRPMKEAAPEPQKAGNGTASQPRTSPTNGHGGEAPRADR